MHNQRRPLYIDDRGRPFAVNPRGKKYYNVNLSMQGGSINNPQNTSGDFVLQDDSDDDLFQVNDGNSPSLSAKYEGSSSFTIGYRTGLLGSSSMVLGGSSSSTQLNSVSGSQEASGDRSISMGFGNSSSGVESISIGYENTVEQLFSVGIGYNNTLSENLFQGQTTYVFGKDNTVGPINNNAVVGHNNTIGDNASENTYLIGDNLSAGTNGNSMQNASVILGSDNNPSHLTSGKYPLILGSGSGGDSMYVKLVGVGNPVLHTNSIFLGNSGNNNGVEDISNNIGHEPDCAIHGRDVVFGSSGAYLDDSIGLGDPNNLNNEVTSILSSLFINSSLQNYDNSTAGPRETIAINSTLDNIGVVRESLIINTDLNSSNISEYVTDTSTSGNDTFIFAYNDKTLVGFGEGERNGSVIISGGSIGNVGNSVSIGATVNNPNVFKVGKSTANFAVTDFQMNGTSGASGTFTDGGGNTITVNNGIITALS